ncbi:hypothetical protein INT43_001232, partial [Umbelopsis isabellina]
MPVPFKMLDGSDPIPSQPASGSSSYINDSVFDQAPQFAKTHSNMTSYNELAPSSHSVPSADDEIDLLSVKGEQLMKTAITVIQKLLPEWNDVEHAELDRVSGAMTNAVFFVTAQNPYRRVLLRVYGIGCDQLVDREQELVWLGILSRLGIGALLLGTFANGRVEQYLDCYTLTRDDIRVPKTSCQIARGLYELHAIVHSYPNEVNILPELWRNIFNWIPIVQSILPNLEKRSEHHRSTIKCFDLPQAFADMPVFKKYLDNLHSPIVFAHNDTQYGNIMRLRDGTERLVVVDFEYSGYNPRGFDIANHFCEWTADYHSNEPAKMHENCYPSLAEQTRFIDAYLDERDVVQGITSSKSQRQLEVDQLLREVAGYRLASHFFWSLWGLIQANQSEIDYDFFQYATERMTSFQTGWAAWKNT